MDEIFGGLFDFDNNGVTDNFEAALGFEIMSDATMNFYGEEEEQDFDYDDDEELDFDDPLCDTIVDGDF